MLFTNNHEEAGMSALEELASDNSFQVSEGDLQVDVIPDTTRIITIFNPQRDFTNAEINMLDAFADRGDVGFLVFLSPESQQSQLTNLTEFLKEWNITPQDDIVMDNTYYYGNEISNLIAERGENDITAGIDTNVKLIMPYSKSLDISAKSGGIYDSYSIIRSASTSSSIKGTEVTQGNFDLAAASSKGIVGSSSESKMIVFGSAYIAHSDLLSSNTFANSQIMINSFNYIRGEQDIAEILPKYYEDYSKS
jgi:hypothetical protein